MRWIAYILFVLFVITMIGCATPASTVESGVIVEDMTQPTHAVFHVTWKIESRF